MRKHILQVTMTCHFERSEEFHFSLIDLYKKYFTDNQLISKKNTFFYEKALIY